MKLTINGRALDVRAAPDTPLLWVLRDELGLTGTKYGCGKGLCGACTVHIDGVAQRTCILPVGTVEGKGITTIEGLTVAGAALHPVQRSEEHTSELQSPDHIVCRLLLEKKKKIATLIRYLEIHM